MGQWQTWKRAFAVQQPASQVPGAAFSLPVTCDFSTWSRLAQRAWVQELKNQCCSWVGKTLPCRNPVPCFVWEREGSKLPACHFSSLADRHAALKQRRYRGKHLHTGGAMEPAVQGDSRLGATESGDQSHQAGDAGCWAVSWRSF